MLILECVKTIQRFLLYLVACGKILGKHSDPKFLKFSALFISKISQVNRKLIWDELKRIPIVIVLIVLNELSRDEMNCAPSVRK